MNIQNAYKTFFIKMWMTTGDHCDECIPCEKNSSVIMRTFRGGNGENANRIENSQIESTNSQIESKYRK